MGLVKSLSDNCKFTLVSYICAAGVKAPAAFRRFFFITAFANGPICRNRPGFMNRQGAKGKRSRFGVGVALLCLLATGRASAWSTATYPR
jgi:hypothetical protein